VTTTSQSASERAVLDVIQQSLHQAAAGTVFGEPISRGDITIIPVARISGRGGGGGGGGGPDGEHAGGSGSGSGLKLSAEPAGVFVVDGGRVQWRPSGDVNKMIVGGQLVAIAALLTVRALVRSRPRGLRRRRRAPMSRRRS